VDPVTGYSPDYGYGYATSNVSYTIPDGFTGGSGYDALGNAVANCSFTTPCFCTAAKPCTQTIGGPVTVQGVANVTFQAVGGTGAACTDAAPCTCVTNPATGTKTACVAVLKTCTAAAPCDAAPTTLVKSPVVAACSACHDSDMAIDHMRTNGGTFYEPRSVYKQRDEECMVCHGPNRLAAIALVHTDRTP
jgi:hypothetical protein